MAEPMSDLSPVKLNVAAANAVPYDDDIDMTWHDPPSSPFVDQVDQENISPVKSVVGTSTPVKAAPLLDLDDNPPQSAFKVSPEKKFGLKRDRSSPMKNSPNKKLLDDFEGEGRSGSINITPTKPIMAEYPESAASVRSRRNASPTKSSRAPSLESPIRLEDSTEDSVIDIAPTPSRRQSAPRKESELRDNEGLTVAMKVMEETHTESHARTSIHKLLELDDTGIEFTDYNPEGPEFTSLDVDDTGFSNFSEMPQLDMTKFAGLRKSPTKNGIFDQATPRARGMMTPSTVRRSERTPSPTPRQSRKENDTTNLLLDFTAQFESFSSSGRGRTSPTKSTTEPNLASYYQNQRSPAKVASNVPSTPSQNRHLLNLLDFELPPAPTPRSLPTVTIRELESMKSSFQSQISSLTASLSGKEAEVDSLARAIADAERRVGESQEYFRDERSAREYAEAQMEDWKKKGEEVQRLLQDVQAELAHNDNEREQLLARLADAEKRAEEAESRSSDLETRLIEAESKNTDMTTFINPDEGEGTRKIYSEAECQTAIAEKVNEVARDLHAAYKAKHEKKIKALKDNYQKKADERCKELRAQIVRLERQVEESEKKRDDTLSKVGPDQFGANSEGKCDKCGKNAAESAASGSNAEDIKRLEEQQSEIQNLKAKLAGLQSELSSLRKSHDILVEDLEAERIEKGELVAAAEQMLSLCGEKMEEMQQGELRKSQAGGAPPTAPPAESAMRSTGFLAGGPPPSRPGSALGGGRPGSAIGDRFGGMGDKNAGAAKPSGMRAPGGKPGGFGFQAGASALNRSTSGSKSRLMSNIERMGGGRSQE